MKKLIVLCLLLLQTSGMSGQTTPPASVIKARIAPVLRVNGLLFKDLNKNGKLDVYEDWRLSPQNRAKDMVQQMMLEE